MEATVVPFFLRSVGLSASVLQRKESDVLECSVFQGIKWSDKWIGSGKRTNAISRWIISITNIMPYSKIYVGYCPWKPASNSNHRIDGGKWGYAEHFVGNFIWDLCGALSGNVFLIIWMS